MDNVEPHRLVEVDTRLDLFRTGPARHYAYCARSGCRWWWNGIGSLETCWAEHVRLKDPPPAA